jgi:hypothetical protein
VFDSNGGTGTMQSQKHIYGYDKALTANSFTRNGYIFLGWSRTKQNPISEYDASKITYNDGASVTNLTTGTGDVTLYAVWLETWSAVSKDVELTTDASGAYLISSAEELGKVAYMVNFEDNNFAGKTIRLANNIDLTGYHWMQIGFNVSFQGSRFEGNGWTIKNVNVFDEYENLLDKSKYFNKTGLFGNVENTKINNLRIENVNSISNMVGGGIVGFAKNSIISNCQVVSGTISAQWECGGIVGGAENTVIENCSNYATVAGNYPAGIAGAIRSRTEVRNCINYGYITGSSRYSAGYAGGIVAIDDGWIIESCINYGNIYQANSLYVAGGISGLIRGEVTIESCANYGDVQADGTGTHIGAIVGKNESTQLIISNCSSVSALSSIVDDEHLIYSDKAPYIMSSSYVVNTKTNQKQAYGNAEDFNMGFRYVEGMNNNLPMQVTLFEYAQNLPQQNDVFEVGLAGFERI